MYPELPLPCQYKYIDVYTHYDNIYIKENLRFVYVWGKHLCNICPRLYNYVATGYIRFIQILNYGKVIGPRNDNLIFFTMSRFWVDSSMCKFTCCQWYDGIKVICPFLLDLL